MSKFVTVSIQSLRTQWYQVTYPDEGQDLEVYLTMKPLPGGGQDMQAIVDPVSIEGGLLWKCWLREIKTPRIDALRAELRERSIGEIPPPHINLTSYSSEVICDVLDAYLEAHNSKGNPVARVSRYERTRVI
jgi:hypothetical protein